MTTTSDLLNAWADFSDKTGGAQAKRDPLSFFFGMALGAMNAKATPDQLVEAFIAAQAAIPHPAS